MKTRSRHFGSCFLYRCIAKKITATFSMLIKTSVAFMSATCLILGYTIPYVG